MTTDTTSPQERVLAALSHRQPDRVPVDFGGTFVTGIHITCVAALRDYFGLKKHPVKVLDAGQMLGEVDDELKERLGVDVEGLLRRMSRFGFPNSGWKPWKFFGGLEISVPGDFSPSTDANGDTLLHPGGDHSLPASARMPANGYFFDNIVRQHPIDEDKLDPKDNLEEYGPVSEEELTFLEKESRRARATGRVVAAGFGGTAFGDIGSIPAPWLRDPKGIRDITEWYMSIRSRRPYIHKVFEGQCEIALANLKRIAARVGDTVDVVYICGTDFGTQNSSFCSVGTFRELWLPYYKAINSWIHKNTKWKTFKHSCGAIAKFLPSLIEAEFDIINPVQCSAEGMDPATLKRNFGSELVFWGGGVDTQSVLPFGTPAEVREQVLRRCEIFAPGGGFVFSTVHNVQAGTPIPNIIAMIEAVKEFNGVS